jgi:dihydrolipoamide dehydrogenase
MNAVTGAPAAGNAAHAEVLVIGGGPGGYTAAFRAADLGLQVVLVDERAALGGVCLNVGCIPSKALLHAAKVVTEAQAMSRHGIRFEAPQVDLAALRSYKNGIVGKLTRGLAGLARQRKVTVVQGRAAFTSAHGVVVQAAAGPREIRFEHCIIAAGSSAVRLPGLPADDARLFDSTGALELADLPRRMLVIGGGIIGLEMATVYDALGCRVSVVEMTPGLIPEADRDLVAPLQARLARRLEAIMLGTRVETVQPESEGLRVSFSGTSAPAEPQLYDRVLVAVGRRPNGLLLDADRAGIAVDGRGFVATDRQCRTGVSHIFAIGDLTGGPMLAHKASHQGRVAAETIAGREASFEPVAIPNVAYTEPEIAWAGLTETAARAAGIAYQLAVFPWMASGRAHASACTDGLTKLLFDPASRRLLGAGITGAGAGELIAETVLALESGVDVQAMMHAIHPHPTLSESIALAAEIADGSITDLLLPKAPVVG